MRNFELKLAEERVDLELAHKKAERVLAQDAVEMEDFRELYGNENVERDKKEVERLEREFDSESTAELKEQKKLADVLEAVLHEHIELSDWLGPEAHTTKASRYDDIKNGVDSIVEFQKPDKEASHLALAVDATFSAELDKKMRRVKNEIENGKLSEVKYFNSEYMGFKGKLSQVPRVIVGIEKRNAKELMEIWMQNDKKALAEHPVKNIVLTEIMRELDVFEKYAGKSGQKEDAARYQQMKNTIEKAVPDSKKLKDYETDDEVFKSIQAQLKNF